MLSVPSISSHCGNVQRPMLKLAVFAVSSTVYVPNQQFTCPTGVRGLVPSDFGRLAAIICQDVWPFSSNIAIPLTPGPHGSCFYAVLGWSYTESNIQVPTRSSLRVFCWPSASLGGRAIPRHRNAKAVMVSVVRRFIVFIVLWSVFRYLFVAYRPASGFLRLQETSVSRGSEGMPLVKASERHGKERLYLLGVKGNIPPVRQNAYRQAGCRTLGLRAHELYFVRFPPPPDAVVVRRSSVQGSLDSSRRSRSEQSDGSAPLRMLRLSSKLN
jgi:hypothetical protein